MDEPPKLPDPDTRDRPRIPSNLRWPLEGKVESPTVPPMTAGDRRAGLEAVRKSRSRKGYLLGLLVGQALIVGVIFGGDRLLQLRPDLQTGLPLRLIVLLGVTGGLAITGALIGVLLFFQGLGYVFRPRGKSPITALGNGLCRVGRAIGSLGLTLLVLGGTAAATIAPHEWPGHGKMLRKNVERVRLPAWIR